MPTTNPPGRTAIVTGASRGFGRATAVGLAATGVHVVGVARDEAALEEVQSRQLGDVVHAGRRRRHRRPSGRPTDRRSTARPSSCSTPARHRTRRRSRTRRGRHSAPTGTSTSDTSSSSPVPRLLAPLDPGSTVISVSSGAARQGSPMSGGYAGAKATVNFISAYAGSRIGTQLVGDPLRVPAAEADSRHRAGSDVRRRLRRLMTTSIATPSANASVSRSPPNTSPTPSSTSPITAPTRRLPTCSPPPD